MKPSAHETTLFIVSSKSFQHPRDPENAQVARQALRHLAPGWLGSRAVSPLPSPCRGSNAAAVASWYP